MSGAVRGVFFNYLPPAEEAVSIRWALSLFPTLDVQVSADERSGNGANYDDPRFAWWAQEDSNLRPPACKAGALHR